MTATNISRVALVVFAGLLLAVPVVMPMFVSPFWIDIIAEILIWSLLAASVNLLLGYVGLLSFGQALFFGVGMYGAALSVIHWGADFWGGLAVGIVAAMLMAAIAGSVAVRLTWHYFAIITVVFSLILYFAAMSAKPITGGDDGISFSTPKVFSFGDLELSLADQSVQYYTILLVVAACYGLFGFIVRSPLGVRFMAVRENDRRAALVGINVYLTRYLAFVLAGGLAGASGALFAFFGRYASASYMFYHVSGEAVVWAIVGGAGSLLGPLFGTGLLIIFRELISTVWEHYLFVVGAITVLVVMFAPRGLAGAWSDFMKVIGRNKRAETPTSNPGLSKPAADTKLGG
ncbi:branched-chain amino acid ABC transporter permease [Filomicrobium sp.]|uniref:branched-chain amino acid ABC transporter permease n=1 Tax=Filomicrobium sp. TaxID=2024831 RepID=UPI00258B4341|nr:branched-chain amino acid ABC transporter permease [Filomicrobium sp.]MCV0367930.1 branched-chain amino acid ABC transporter permease [Filomicrobium sp.]